MKSIPFTIHRESDLAAEFIADLHYHSVRFDIERDGTDIIITIR